MEPDPKSDDYRIALRRLGNQIAGILPKEDGEYVLECAQKAYRRLQKGT